AKQRLEELIQEHLRRNPRIAEPEGAANDWLFRNAVREQLGICFDRNRVRWHCKLPNGRHLYRGCITFGVLDALRLICEEQVRRKKVEQHRREEEDAEDIAATNCRKRKLHENGRSSDLSRGEESSPSEASVPTGIPSFGSESGRASEAYALRREVSSLKCSVAGLRKLAEERQERIDELEAAAWARQAVADGAEGGGVTEGAGPGQIDALTGEVDKWKTKYEEALELRNQDRQAAAEELELAREVNSMRESAMRGELKALREETAGLEKALTDAQYQLTCRKIDDDRIRKIERTCEATLNNVRYITDWTQGTQVPRPVKTIEAELKREGG
ncbi:hypothetical protein FOZ63_003145, partial [Perkinsus olseni]